jgi:hypothetical protein
MVKKNGDSLASFLVDGRVGGLWSSQVGRARRS